TRQVTLDAFDHQDTPLDKVVEAVWKERNPSYHPLFQVLFIYQHTMPTEIPLGDLELRGEGGETRTAKFDMILTAVAVPEGLLGFVEYNTDLFDAATIERLSGHYRALLEEVAGAPERRLSELAALQAVAQDPLVTAARTAAPEQVEPPDRQAREKRLADEQARFDAKQATLSKAKQALLAKWMRKG
ncbi:MAG: hypothetical protein GY856_40740, partial [bacterium]|nr:hypothetical protein [bacterium]